MKSTHFAITGVLLSSLICGLCSCASTPEAKSARYLEAGKKLLKNKDATRAILQFQNAVKATPNNAEAYYQLATACLAAGDATCAGNSLRRALDLNPKHAKAQLLIARLKTATNDKDNLEDARKRLRQLVEGSPDDSDVLHALALTELKLGDPQDAMRDLEKATSLSPQNVLIAVTLAQAKLQEHDPKGAEEALKQLIASAPKSAVAVVALGKLYSAENRPQDAEQQYRQAVSMDPSDSGALLSLGVLQYQTGKKNEAEQTFRKLSRMPDPEARTSLAAFLSREGRQSEALQELGRLFHDDPNDRTLRTLLVKAYLVNNRKSDAEKLLNEALKKNPKDLDAMLQRGEIALGEGKFDRAENDLNQVLHLQSISPEVHYVLGRLYLARKENLRYRQELTKTLELNPYLLAVRLELAGELISENAGQAALEALDHAAASQKALPAMVAQRNWALWTTGDMAELRKGIDQGLAMDKSPEFLLQDGLWKLRAGNPAGASAALESALNINPGDMRALAALRSAMTQLHQPAMAIEKVKEYASKQPKSAAAQEFLGTLLAAQGRRDEARQAFVAAKIADPQSTLADFRMVQMEVADRKVEDAERRLQGLLSSRGENATARLWLGNLNEVKGNHAAALDNYQKAVQGDPANAQALNNLAYVLADFGKRPEQALKYAEKARQIDPDNAEYADTMGWILYQKGLYSSAIQQFEAVSGREGPVVWKYHLAMAYAKNGEMARGRATLNAALKINPNVPEAQAAKALLAVQ